MAAAAHPDSTTLAEEFLNKKVYSFGTDNSHVQERLAILNFLKEHTTSKAGSLPATSDAFGFRPHLTASAVPSESTPDHKDSLKTPHPDP